MYKDDLRKQIGQEVEVIIDRPLGSYHPDYPDMKYELNYGYIKEMIAPDGADQDAYVLGTDEPLETAKGKVIAIIHRNDDVEEKLVVSVSSYDYSDEEIRLLTDFQERYFDSEILRR